MKDEALDVSADSVIIIGLDVMEEEGGKGAKPIAVRRHFLCSGAEFLDGKLTQRRPVSPKTVFSAENASLFEKITSDAPANKVHLVLYPTRTYSETSGANLFSDVAPEDRKLMRKVRSRFPDRMAYFKVPLAQAGLFEKIPGYLAGDEETEKFRRQQAESRSPSAAREQEQEPRYSIELDAGVPAKIGPILKSCITRPNKQDLFYVLTKSLGLNMAIKITFATISVLKGELPLVRAVVSTIWYQSQDVFFTLFGQTYMKFLGKMSRMLRVGRGYYGDLLFCFIQFTCFEIMNRTILGPLGENPLAYTWAGIALILANNLKGMISGGPTTPAIIRVRRSGAISHKTMMHIYQLCGLTFHFGTFAAFGYQKTFAILTTTQMIVSWGTFFLFSIFFKDPQFATADSAASVERLNAVALSCGGAEAKAEQAPA